MATFVDGNIVDAKEDYICHQCNCISDHALGLASIIFKAFPYADCYSNRKQDMPGTIDVRGNGQDKRFVIGMYAQKYPGKPMNGDSANEREKWFEKCLEQISLMEHESKTPSFAFPYRIGCGMAGGDWDNYLTMLDKFGQDHPNYNVVIYDNRI